MKKAIIFDFDGVIGRSEQSRFKVFKTIFSQKGLLLPDEEFKNMVGRTTKVFLANLNINELTPALADEIRDDYNKESL